MSGPNSAASSYLVQADDGERTWSIVLDLGPGSFGSLMREIDPAAIDAVFLSHLHADHMSDMISYHVYRRWHPGGALGPVSVYAPPDAVDRVRGVGGDGPEEMYSTEFGFAPIADRGTIRVGPFAVTAHAVQHPVEAYALRVEGPSRKGGRAVLTYSGDTDACDGLVTAARGADLLLSEAAFIEGRDTIRGIHLTGLRAGECATEAEARLLVLTHIQPWTEPEDVATEARRSYTGPVEIARAGASWEI